MSQLSANVASYVFLTWTLTCYYYGPLLRYACIIITQLTQFWQDVDDGTARRKYRSGKYKQRANDNEINWIKRTISADVMRIRFRGKQQHSAFGSGAGGHDSIPFLYRFYEMLFLG